MGLTPRIWSHLAGVWQVRSVLRPPQTVYSLISTITAVPDRAPRAGGARGRRVLKEFPQARPAAPRLSQMSGVHTVALLVSLVFPLLRNWQLRARSANSGQTIRRAGPCLGLGVRSCHSAVVLTGNAHSNQETKFRLQPSVSAAPKMPGVVAGGDVGGTLPRTLNPSISHGPEGGRLRALQAYESRNYRHCHQALRCTRSCAAQGRRSDSLEGVE